MTIRYRRLDASGDAIFGHSSADFLVDSPEAVAQAVLTRLRMLRGEWFLDSTEGTPWATEILGEHTGSTYDFAIRERISGTSGVTEIVSYTSSLSGRALAVSATLNTAYGQATVSAVL